ncbi:MAG: hypothetical protein HY711_10725 [Candidatus Melainabacteria bacterium]|nr:hypothetical protein [Candidatus Melainabacteria bacterium]
MYPAILIRCGVDWVRHHEGFKDSNPYSRCEEAIKVCTCLWEDQWGKSDLVYVEPAAVAAYWAEFFHAEDPLADELEWREGLIKRSGQYDSFEEWQKWFKQSYAKVYKDDNIWLSLLMTSWAHTHQYEVFYCDDSWEFRPAASYLPTSELWRLTPHTDNVAIILKELWLEELKAYLESGFTIADKDMPYVGKAEALGFDVKKYRLVWPSRANRMSDFLELGEMVADIILPPGDDWYRHLDNIIFAHDHVDITSLVNRAKYVFGSRRRLLELTIDNTPDEAKMQASAEGWLVPEMETAPAL